MFAGMIFLIIFIPLAILPLALNDLFSADELSEMGIASDRIS